MKSSVAIAVLVLSVATVNSAGEKDSQAAANTRKKLQIKVTAEYKEEYFSEILRDLKKQVEDAGGGSLSFFNDAGVSNNTKYTFSGKDITLAAALDGICKKNSLGYVVISKPGDRYDGWIKFKQGNERGYPSGDEPKTKNPVKEAEKQPNADEKNEKAAQAKLDLARELVKDGKKDRAKQRLEELIQTYPNTKAAAEAKKELEKLGR